jgi:hypothetical protein
MAAMVSATRVMAVLGAAGVLLGPAGAGAQTQLDFDTCNQMARASAASPSASPGSGAYSGGSTMTSPGSIEANRQPNATGRISGSAGSPGTAAGTMPPGDPTGSRGGADVQLRGMAAAGASDEAYRQAYRDCMKARGF